MRVRAKVSFGGVISMTQGQTADLPADDTLHDLLEAGYVEPEEAEETEGQTVGYLDREQLEEMTVSKLRELAKEMGLNDSGKKAELIERIAAQEVSVEKGEGGGKNEDE